MICGDITNDSIFETIIDESIRGDIDIIMATPPCQGMSTVGQKLPDDERNKLVCYVLKAIKRIKPKYVFIENVPSFFNTEISIQDEKVLISELLENEVGSEYVINKTIIDTKDYSVPQTRERAIVLMSRNDQKKSGQFQKKQQSNNNERCYWLSSKVRPVYN